MKKIFVFSLISILVFIIYLSFKDDELYFVELSDQLSFSQNSYSFKIEKYLNEKNN